LNLRGPLQVELPDLLLEFLTPEEQKELIAKIMKRQNEEITKALKEANEDGIVL
jgi:hypothetical protein